MNILVTGGAGFIGSNFVHYMLQSYETYKIINLDALTYSGNLNNVKSIQDHPNYYFVKGEIQNGELLEHVIRNVMCKSLSISQLNHMWTVVLKIRFLFMIQM